MSAFKEGCARLLSLFRRAALDREFDEEAQSHLDLAVDESLRRGVPEAEARRVARLKFGAVEASKDAHRDSRGLPWLEGLFYDLRFAVRGLRRDRAFTLAAIAMLALAIGLNVTVFTVMDAMLFRGYPLVTRNDRLLYVQEHFPSGRCCISYPDFQEWRSQAQAFDGMAFVGEQFIALRDGDGHSIDTLAFTVSANTFGLLGVGPMLGRDFLPADEVSGAVPVAILNYRFWESRFGKRADVVGATVHLNGSPTTIVGVMPEGFDFPTKENLWIPVGRTPELQRGVTAGGYLTVGRLRESANIQQARAELETINRRLAAAYPATNRGVVPILHTHAEMVSGPDASIIWGSLWAGSWFVLLIACANLANLTLLRTVGRWRDLSTRIALGAGAGRIMRQIFVEGLMVAGVAGALGWWISNWSVRRWAAATASIYQVLDYTVSSATLAYVVVISAAAAILFSLVPIGRVMQLGVSGVLKGDARGVTQGLRGKHLAAGLVAGQMALAIVLLSGAGVIGRSFVKIVRAETGVRDPGRVLVGLLRLPSDQYASPATRLAYFDRLDAQLRAIPGIEETSVASVLPVHGSAPRPFEIDGRPSPSDGGDAVQFLTVGSDYFNVIGASAISGRHFNDGDRTETSKVIIVNQSFAARFWPGDQPIGKRLRPSDRTPSGEWRTVVGVVPNIMQGDPLRQQFKPLVYVPARQYPLQAAFVLMRTRVPSDQVIQAVRAEVQRLDPGVALEDLTTLRARLAFERDYMDPEHSELGKYAGVAPVFALIALVLSAIGLYAVLAHSVSQRTNEIGVRIAIGATARDIHRLIFREGMRPVALGLIAGLMVSLAVNRIVQSQLVGVSPYDPVTLATAPAVLILVALVACHIPARRAMHVNPVVALRHE